MSKCSAGECDVECGGNKGCGCIALSDDPWACSCYCFGNGSGPSLGVKLDPSTLVDVSINDLPYFEAATFLARVYKERILVPAERASDNVSIQSKAEPMRNVVRQVGLTTREAIDGEKRRLGWSMFLAGFAAGAATLALTAGRRD